MDQPQFGQHPSENPLDELRNRLQRLHRLRGEPSVRDLARGTGHAISHATVHMVLRCTKTPKWGALELVVEALDGGTDEFRRLWIAVRDAEDGTAYREVSAPTGFAGEVAVRPADRPTVNPLPDWGAAGRVAAYVPGTSRPDPAMHAFLARALVQLRLIEDHAGAREVLTSALTQVPVVEALRSRADGRLHDDLLSLESQWAQFCGWLYQDLGDRAASEQWYARALDQAHEVGDDDMVASVLSERANAAWGLRDAKRCIALSRASYQITTASPGVRALAAQQLARGHALTGDRDECERAIDVAARLSEQAAADPERIPPWIYYQSSIRLDIQRAMCYRDLGMHSKAIDMVRRAIGALPATYRRDRGQYLARLAVALFHSGEPEEAGAVAAQARQLAEETGSIRTVLELQRIPALESWASTARASFGSA
jgi:tetratricopeptide (TPR) repeat protein